MGYPMPFHICYPMKLSSGVLLNQNTKYDYCLTRSSDHCLLSTVFGRCASEWLANYIELNWMYIISSNPGNPDTGSPYTSSRVAAPLLLS